MSVQSKSGTAFFKIRQFSWGEPLVFLLFIPLLLLPGRFAPLAWHPYWLTLLGLLTLRQWGTRRQQRWLCTPLDGAMGLIVLWLPVNYWVSINKGQSLEAMGYLLYGIASYRACIQWRPLHQAPARLVYLFFFVGVALTALGPLLLIADPNFISVLPLVHFSWLTKVAQLLAATINPNVLAGALVLLLPLYTALILQKRLSFHRMLRGSLLILWPLMVGVLLLTESRGALLAAAFAVLLVVVLCYARAVWLLPLGVLLLLIGVEWIGPRPLLEALVASSALGGLDGRIEIWSRALYALHDFPFTGIGIGTFKEVIPLLYPYFIWRPEQQIPHAHNLFLQIGVDLGLIGLFGQLALWLTLLGMLAPLLRKRNDSAVRPLALGALGSLMAMFLHGLVDAVTWGNKLAFLPWWLYALITLLFLQEQPNWRVTALALPLPSGADVESGGATEA